MAKNLIPEICKMLGVELGEEFKLKCVDNGQDIEGKFCFKENELYFVNEVGESYIRNDFCHLCYAASSESSNCRGSRMKKNTTIRLQVHINIRSGK